MRRNTYNIDFFQKNGVVCLRDAFSLEQISWLREAVSENTQKPSRFGCQYENKQEELIFYDDYCNWDRIRGYEQFAFQTPLGELAAELLKSREVSLFHEHMIVKGAGSRKPTPWHQDLPYYPIEGEKLISFWIPLDPVSAKDGVSFWAGSHLNSQRFIPTKFLTGLPYDDSRYPNYQVIPHPSQNTTLLSWAVEVGDVIAFDMATVHGQPSSLADHGTANSRRSVAFRLFGEDTRWASRPWECSPPFPEVNLKPGEAVIHELFPKIYSAEFE